MTGGSSEDFPRRSRLTDAEDYRRVFKHPRTSKDSHLTVLAACNSGAHPRLGLAIARKQVRKAAQRNRIKRLVRESFRRHQQTLGGLDLVVMARAAAGAAENGVLLRALERHWNELIGQCKRS